MRHRDPVIALRSGDLVVMVDDQAAEGGAELWLAAECAGAAQFARLVRHTSGFVSVAVPTARANTLGLPPMLITPETWTERLPVQAVTCDAAEGITTGISAADRAVTARLLADPAAGPEDFTRPGHIVPLRVRQGVTNPDCAGSAALELCAYSGLRPAMVRCELVQPSGRLASAADGLAFAEAHGVSVVARAELAGISPARVG